eukprot:5397-Heterococcus_DN1.PRE.2
MKRGRQLYGRISTEARSSARKQIEQQQDGDARRLCRAQRGRNFNRGEITKLEKDIAAAAGGVQQLISQAVAGKAILSALQILSSAESTSEHYCHLQLVLLYRLLQHRCLYELERSAHA